MSDYIPPVGGAATGAAVGFLTGGPVGAAIGAVIGGFVGAVANTEDDKDPDALYTGDEDAVHEGGSKARSRIEEVRKPLSAARGEFKKTKQAFSDLFRREPKSAGFISVGRLDSTGAFRGGPPMGGRSLGPSFGSGPMIDRPAFNLPSSYQSQQAYPAQSTYQTQQAYPAQSTYVPASSYQYGPPASTTPADNRTNEEKARDEVIAEFQRRGITASSQLSPAPYAGRQQVVIPEHLGHTEKHALKLDAANIVSKYGYKIHTNIFHPHRLTIHP